MRARAGFVAAVLGCWIAIPLLAQEVYYVDRQNCPGPGNGSESSPYCTIQQGIDRAISGDFVWVMPGVYAGPGNVNLDFAGKNLMLWGDLGGVIIDGENTNRIFHFHSGETHGAEVFRFTLRNGGPPEGQDGGAVLIENSSPFLNGCVIETSHALNGGGVCIKGFGAVTAELLYVTFRGNTAADRGAGIFVENASPSLTRCEFHNNVANVYGGAALFRDAGGVFDGCTFIDNSADGGAGIAGENALLDLTGCTFVRNIATSNSGGAISLREATGTSTIRDCTFSLNKADFGGAIYSADGDPVITNGLFTMNHAKYRGGAIYITSGDGLLTNCTIADNTADFSSGGLHNQNGANGIVNCILWRNAPQQIGLTGSGAPIVSHSLVQGGWFGTAVLNTDPRFGAGPTHPYHLRHPDTGHADLSPCFDAGATTIESVTVLGLTTRRDQWQDIDPVDLGYHAPLYPPNLIKLGDFARDGRIDLRDFQVFQACVTAPGEERSPACWQADFDTDLDIDAADYADWAPRLAGP